jgi:hypothetical protein
LEIFVERDRFLELILAPNEARPVPGTVARIRSGHLGAILSRALGPALSQRAASEEEIQLSAEARAALDSATRRWSLLLRHRSQLALPIYLQLEDPAQLRQALKISIAVQRRGHPR